MPLSCRLTGPFRSWPAEAERPRGPAAAKDTEARGRPRLVSIRERLEKDRWRLPEKLLTDRLEDMMAVWKGHRTGSAVTTQLDLARQASGFNQPIRTGRWTEASGTAATDTRPTSCFFIRWDETARGENVPGQYRGENGLLPAGSRGRDLWAPHRRKPSGSPQNWDRNSNSVRKDWEWTSRKGFTCSLDF